MLHVYKNKNKNLWIGSVKHLRFRSPLLKLHHENTPLPSTPPFHPSQLRSIEEQKQQSPDGSTLAKSHQNTSLLSRSLVSLALIERISCHPGTDSMDLLASGTPKRSTTTDSLGDLFDSVLLYVHRNHVGRGAQDGVLDFQTDPGLWSVSEKTSDSLYTSNAG